MVTGYATSLLNPIRLKEITEFERSYFRTTEYFQKFNQSDATQLQTVTDLSVTIQAAYIFDYSGKRVKYFPIDNPATELEDTRVWNIDIDFTGVKEDVYVLCVELDNGIKLYSDCIQIKKHHEKTCLLSYWNTTNDFNVVFATKIKFSIRVDGGFLPTNLTPQSQDTIYQDQEVNFVNLKSSPYNLYTLTIGTARGVTDWMIDIINRALSCNKFRVKYHHIDNYFVKNEGATLEELTAEDYDLRSWTIPLAKEDNSGITPTPQTLTALWTSYICRQKSQIPNIFTAEATAGRATPGENNIAVKCSLQCPYPVASQVQVSYTISVVFAGGSVGEGGSHIFNIGENVFSNYDNPLIFEWDGDIDFNTLECTIVINSVTPEQDEVYIYKEGVEPVYVNTGTEVAYVLGIFKYEGDIPEPYYEKYYSILSAFGAYPSISLNDYRRLSEADLTSRRDAFITHVRGIEGYFDIENEFEQENIACTSDNILGDGNNNAVQFANDLYLRVN